ncbi:MAG: hypothetical protein JO224_12515 [Pelomonas sp.]|nr:hypothetical protein [Roseateles sp.]
MTKPALKPTPAAAPGVDAGDDVAKPGLKRLALELRRQARALTTLSARECRALLQAAAVLERVDRGRRPPPLSIPGAPLSLEQAKTIVAMRGNFLTLQTVADQVALIGLMRPDLLRRPTHRIASLAELQDSFGASLDQLATVLASQAGEDSIHAVVQQAWQRFQQVRDRLETTHRPLIDTLTAAAAAAAPAADARGLD